MRRTPAHYLPTSDIFKQSIMRQPAGKLLMQLMHKFNLLRSKQLGQEMRIQMPVHLFEILIGLVVHACDGLEILDPSCRRIILDI